MVSHGPTRAAAKAFTFVELLILLLCLAIAAGMVIPVLANTGAYQLKAAAQLLVADLEYAQTQSLIHADDPRIIVFDSAANTYHIAARSDPDAPLIDPAEGGPYITRFGAGRAAAMPRVRIADYELGGDNQLAFGPYGQIESSSASGPIPSITLACDQLTITIVLDPITGEVTVQ